MENRDNIQSNNITGRIRSSLVIKLNMRMLQRVVSGFLAINFLILLMGMCVILWKAEGEIRDIVETIGESPDERHPNQRYYRLSMTGDLSKGMRLPRQVQRRLPLGIEGATRSVNLPDSNRGVSLLEKLGTVEYIVGFEIRDLSYEIEYPLGPEVKLFFILFMVLLGFQLLIIVRDMSKGSRAIRKTLRPLEDLAKTARTLNREVSTLGVTANDASIKDLAGAISSIDANRLDSHISVDSSQTELKDLASAINAMLNRINASYQSQVRFVSDASHELRTPISVIQGYVNLLDRWGKRDEETMQESIDAIKSETENMKELVEQLLFLARGDNETLELHREVFDPCQVIEEVIRETQLIDESHNFELDLKGPAHIEADRQLIKQAIRIFVDNSIKYTPSDDKIVLRVLKEDNRVHIIVQDNGIGIAPKDLPNIFDRFYRSDESRARKTGGSGLGLSIAKWIIQRHGADFEILSREDIGTRITVIFPETIIKHE